MTAYDARGAEQLVDGWLAAHGDHDVDDEGGTLSDVLECFPEIRDDLQNSIARALGALAPIAAGAEPVPAPPDHDPDYGGRTDWVDPRCQTCGVIRSEHPVHRIESRPSAFGEPHWSILNTAGLVCRCGCGGIFRFLTMAHVPVVFPACSFPAEGTHYSAPPPLGPVQYIGHAESCPHRYGLDQAPRA